MSAENVTMAKLNSVVKWLGKNVSEVIEDDILTFNMISKKKTKKLSGYITQVSKIKSCGATC